MHTPPRSLWPWPHHAKLLWCALQVEVLRTLRLLSPAAFKVLLSNFHRGLKGVKQFKTPVFAFKELDLPKVGVGADTHGLGNGCGSEQPGWWMGKVWPTAIASLSNAINCVRSDQ